MTRRSEGFARLDAQIAEYGEEWVLDSFVARISDGEAPHKIAVGMGYPWFVLRSWLEDKPERVRAWELGKRCFADGLSYEGLRAARDATPDDVSVARLQVDTYQKTASRLNRVEWGGEAVVSGGFSGGVTIVIGEVKAPEPVLVGNIVTQVSAVESEMV